MPAKSVAANPAFHFCIRRSLAGILPFCQGLCRSDAFFFFDRDDLVGRDVFKIVYLPAGPTDFDRLSLSVLGEPERKNQFTGGKVA
jgi:hypothetical protein